MKAVTKMIANREKNIIQFLMKAGQTRVGAIADHLGLSEKTVSNSLKEIDPMLQAFGVTVVRKPKIGVYLEGDSQAFTQVARFIESQASTIPSTKEERVIYIFIQLLKASDYVTIQKLAEALYISRATIEKDMIEVTKMLENEGVALYKKPSKGMKLLIDEREKRALTSKFISNFWGSNWYLKQEGEKVLQAFDTIQADVTGIFPEEGLKEIIAIVREFSETHDFEFTDYAFQSIVIHLAIAVERIRKEEYVGNLASSVMKDALASQQQNTEALVTMLEESLDISIPDFEIGYIQMHLTAAYNQRNDDFFSNPVDPQDDVAGFIAACLAQMAYDQELLEGLTTHMKSAINRLQLGMHFKNPYLSKIKQNFPRAFEEALYLKTNVEQKYDVQVNEDETAYIALHFEAYHERIRSFPDPIHVALVCSTGLGSSRLLAARIKKYFPMIKIEKILSVQAMMEARIDVDLVISTIYLELEGIPSIVVSPMMSKEDLQQVERHMGQARHRNKTRSQPFLDLIQPEYIFAKLAVTTMEEAIAAIGKELITQGIAQVGIVESALRREELSFTSFDQMATPHAEPALINESAIIVATLEKPVKWGLVDVDKIFFIALTEQNDLDLDAVYEQFYKYIDNKRWMERLTQLGTSEAIYEHLIKDGM
ncbi:PRD/PTS system IIA 2 domain-containing regulatory protein [Listeria grandensis FSL F6-0971]|uniref:PRD/PTS system IIA 2 domain-containing regulatory protein n=1 Tax=Listeria grandensis FSL F6-0971 TaxID=1265819 RepID=W7BNW0_9LIST|nr:BglG family transcription antiterminator [Listeria grandensis]EUJ21733.1 PRD/PTS system IIA 2 domain-containing regulatory protein [Listeria grandensis FSL F6-0971]